MVSGSILDTRGTLSEAGVVERACTEPGDEAALIQSKVMVKKGDGVRNGVTRSTSSAMEHTKGFSGSDTMLAASSSAASHTVQRSFLDRTEDTLKDVSMQLQQGFRSLTSAILPSQSQVAPGHKVSGSLAGYIFLFVVIVFFVKIVVFFSIRTGIRFSSQARQQDAAVHYATGRPLGPEPSRRQESRGSSKRNSERERTAGVDESGMPKLPGPSDVSDLLASGSQSSGVSPRPLGTPIQRAHSPMWGMPSGTVKADPSSRKFFDSSVGSSGSSEQSTSARTGLSTSDSQLAQDTRESSKRSSAAGAEQLPAELMGMSGGCLGFSSHAGEPEQQASECIADQDAKLCAEKLQPCQAPSWSARIQSSNISQHPEIALPPAVSLPAADTESAPPAKLDCAVGGLGFADLCKDEGDRDVVTEPPSMALSEPPEPERTPDDGVPEHAPELTGTCVEKADEATDPLEKSATSCKESCGQNVHPDSEKRPVHCEAAA
eukprot:gnl/TRDRNA2_/TRDRNA2_83163_c1_seq1.p1 gnl/TRDRNA2_/TRDRNA2_83163_c1~~gnl/TRDRNA2_/TRDRNA2_83163_c1_seq1.p1  ORF type:complete len:540 (+),score=90.69 gnl/TRDRNA2_/TRDRNA2_83163_c1_seq1:152-1621(+)